MNAESIIPQFPPGYVKENGRCIDWGVGNLIAYASGCVVHLSYVDGDILKRQCSIEVAPYPVTCLSLHPSRRLLAVGDNQGRTFLWELDNRRFIASAKSPFGNDKALSLCWKDDILMILYESQHLIGVRFTSQYQSQFYRNFEPVWAVELSNYFNNISVDPHYNCFLLFSGPKSVFSIYKVENALKEPRPYFETIQLTNPDEIQDAQWSLHLPGYVFIVLRGEIMFFHMESKSLMPIITQKSTSSAFSFIVQFMNDYSHLLSFHRSGAISVFENKKFFTFVLKYDFQPKLLNGIAVAAVNSNLRDDVIALYYPSTGLALLDLNSFKIKTVNPIYPANITSFDSDGVGYAYGTIDGYVIFGNCFDSEELYRYSVGTGMVKYVSFDAKHRRIYWQTAEQVGVINLTDRSVVKYQSRVEGALRCFGSHGGAFIVQRDVKALGVFINDKERPLLLYSDTFDVAVDETKSNMNGGRFAVLMKNQSIRFFNYGPNGITENTREGLRPRNTEADAVAFALNGANFVTGFQNGLLLFFNQETKQVRRIMTPFPNLRKLKFMGNYLYGLGGDGHLFEVSDKSDEPRICNYFVNDFCVINEEIILVKMDDNVVRFLNIGDWKPIHYMSKFIKLPDGNDHLKNFIEQRRRGEGLEYMTEEARDVWQVFNGKQSLRLQSQAGIGKPGFYEDLTCELLERAGINSPEGLNVKFRTYLFSNRFPEAAAIISGDDTTDPNYLYKVTFSALLINVTENIDTQTIAHLKMCATALMANQKYKDAAVLFRVGRLDRMAVDYLLAEGQIELALRFIRSVLDGDEKKSAVFKYGADRYTKGYIAVSLPFFAGADEYHAVLAAMLDMGLIADAYFLLQKLKETDRLRPIPDNMKKLVPTMPQLDECIASIETKFAEILKKLQLD